MRRRPRVRLTEIGEISPPGWLASFDDLHRTGLAIAAKTAGQPMPHRYYVAREVAARAFRITPYAIDRYMDMPGMAERLRSLNSREARARRGLAAVERALDRSGPRAQHLREIARDRFAEFERRIAADRPAPWRALDVMGDVVRAAYAAASGDDEIGGHVAAWPVIGQALGEELVDRTFDPDALQLWVRRSLGERDASLGDGFRLVGGPTPATRWGGEVLPYRIAHGPDGRLELHVPRSLAGADPTRLPALAALIGAANLEAEGAGRSHADLRTVVGMGTHYLEEVDRTAHWSWGRPQVLVEATRDVGGSARIQAARSPHRVQTSIAGEVAESPHDVAKRPAGAFAQPPDDVDDSTAALMTEAPGEVGNPASGQATESPYDVGNPAAGKTVESPYDMDDAAAGKAADSPYDVDGATDKAAESPHEVGSSAADDVIASPSEVDASKAGKTAESPYDVDDSTVGKVGSPYDIDDVTAPAADLDLGM